MIPNYLTDYDVEVNNSSIFFDLALLPSIHENYTASDDEVKCTNIIF